jgi:hypothetical protein
VGVAAALDEGALLRSKEVPARTFAPILKSKEDQYAGSETAGKVIHSDKPGSSSVRLGNFSAVAAGLTCGPDPACRSGKRSDSSARPPAPVASTMNVAASAHVSLYANCCCPITDSARQPHTKSAKARVPILPHRYIPAARRNQGGRGTSWPTRA